MLVSRFLLGVCVASVALSGDVSASVLLPSDTNDAEVQSNMGLLPSSRTAQKAVSSKSKQNQENNLLEKKREALILDSLTKGRVPSYTQGKSLLDEKTLQELARIKAEIRKKTARPPLILPEESDSSENLTKNSDKITFSINVEKKYVWGFTDVANLSHHLGYAENIIPQKCQLMANANVNSDRGHYTTSVYSGQTAPLDYLGKKVDRVTFIFQGVCKKPETLPLNGGILRKVGNDYLSVQMSIGSCPFIPKKDLRLTYQGDGNVTCNWE